MDKVLWFSFVMIILAVAIICVYVMIIAGIFTYEFIKEWLEDRKDNV